MVPSITEKAVLTALGNLLSVILPGVTVVVGQTNRVASPEGDYVVMWPITRLRLATNVETALDTKFTASIVGNQMTVTQVFLGAIEKTNQIFGPGIVNNTVVQSQSSGNAGSNGIYVVSVSQNIGPMTMSGGTLEIETSTEFIAQIDVHGPNSGDNAQVISNLIRSSFAVDQMESTGVTPLFSDDARQAPFETAAKEYENRWTIDVHLQIKPSVTTSQEFFDSVVLTMVDVDVVFPEKPGLTTDLDDPANQIIVPLILAGP